MSHRRCSAAAPPLPADSFTLPLLHRRYTFLTLAEHLVGTRAPAEQICFHSAKEAEIATTLVDTFLVIVMLNFLNMLIAQMSNTYDKNRERLAINNIYVSTLCRLAANSTSVVPAPFQIFGLLYYSVRAVLWLAAAAASCVLSAGSPLERAYERARGD